jgi:hypothetical protein
VDGSRSLTARFEWRDRLPFEFRSRWTGRLKIERYPAYRKALNEQIANIKHPRNQTFSGRNAILTVAARFMHVTRARSRFCSAPLSDANKVEERENERQ